MTLNNAVHNGEKVLKSTITICYPEAASIPGNDVQQQAMFSYLFPEARVPQDHPLRPIRDMVNQALRELSGEFQGMYSRGGRPSIPPEKLLRALLLQILYTIRSAQRPGYLCTTWTAVRVRSVVRNAAHGGYALILPPGRVSRSGSL